MIADKESALPGPSTSTDVAVCQSSTSKEVCRKDSTAVRVPRGSLDLFQNKVINVIVPGTVSIHSCHNCGGVGRKRCTTCAGSGSVSLFFSNFSLKLIFPNSRNRAKRAPEMGTTTVVDITTNQP